MKKSIAAMIILIMVFTCGFVASAEDTGGQWGFKKASDNGVKPFRILLIGDSVTNGYRQYVAEDLADIASCDVWLTPAHLNSDGLRDELARIVSAGCYDVIHFNIGLHGWEKGRIPEGQYESLLRKYVETLQKSAGRAVLVWGSTTPIMSEETPRTLDPVNNSVIVERNKIAAKVMAESGIAVNDLYVAVVDKLNLGADKFHWSPEARRLQADCVVRVIKKELTFKLTVLLQKACAPVIKKWTQIEDDKPVEYMTMDGIMVHETNPQIQPQPDIVDPGQPGKAPSDAVVLFDGTEASMKNWTDTNGNQTKWKFADGALESVKDAGLIQSRQTFGSCQLHVEWASPSNVQGSGQGRGNSGVFLMGTYEIQVLDSYQNTTYPDGQAGALYGRKKPLVNASRGPGQWQSYDVIFHRPIFGQDGKVIKQATFTVLHNGVLIHDNVSLTGGTVWRGSHSISEYEPHGDALPIRLQDHGNPVHFRNIWVRPLND